MVTGQEILNSDSDPQEGRIQLSFIPQTEKATRERVTDEITPVSVEHSATRYDDEASHGVGRAFDLDLDTNSLTVAGSEGAVWVKVTLDKVHCIHRVIRYANNGGQLLTWTCTESDCNNCTGADSCSNFNVTVSTEEAVSDLPAVSDCKHGNTVNIDKEGSLLSMFEIAILGKPGNLHSPYYN
ncbi:hypothetical protein ACHWQZ_G013539 [Mnemiopsis leidyi]